MTSVNVIVEQYKWQMDTIIAYRKKACTFKCCKLNSVFKTPTDNFKFTKQTNGQTGRKTDGHMSMVNPVYHHLPRNGRYKKYNDVSSHIR